MHTIGEKDLKGLLLVLQGDDSLVGGLCASAAL